MSEVKIVKFIFDENLSPTLTKDLRCPRAVFTSIAAEGMLEASDTAIWHAAQNSDQRSAIITEDNDFVQLVDMTLLDIVMRERRFDGLAEQVKKIPYVIRVREFLEHGKEGLNNKDEHVNLAAMFSLCSNEIIDDALSEGQKYLHAKLYPDGLTSAYNIEDIVKSYMRDYLNDWDLKDIPLAMTANFDDIFSLRKINDVRIHVGLNAISNEDYPQPAA